MEAIDAENSNDSTDKIKEKVRVVSLEDPSIIASDFAANSNSSVWSLCGLNSDDHHVDLGDISPSISPIFTEQQMADHLRDRLMADDHIFSGEHASNSTNENSRAIPDLQSDLELFDREMKNLESLDGGEDMKSKTDGYLVKSEGHIATKASSNSRRSPRKRGAEDTSSDGKSGIALRTRNRRRGTHAGEVKAGSESGKDVQSKIESEDEEGLNQSDAEQKCENADEKPETVTQNDQNELSKDDKTTDKQQNTATDEDVVSSTLPESPPEQNEENTTETKDDSMNLNSTESEAGRPLRSPDKRVTRSTTGNLKPKQPFDEIQEKEELRNAKRKEGNTGRSKKKEVDGQSSDADGKEKRNEKFAAKTKNSDDNRENESSSDNDDWLDYREDDSDYSPEDDPDRPWCICRKPHGNKFMICCDGCEEWFHGKCVGITMEQGKVMEKRGREYVCDKCREKRAKEAQMSDKAREFAEAIIKTKPDTTTHDSPKKPRQKRRITSSNIVAEPDSSVRPTQVSAPSQSDEIKKKRVREPAGFKIPKKVRTTPTPVSHSQVQPSKKCIVEGCPRTSFEGAVYCGRSCIERHVSEAVTMLSSKEHGGKLHTSEGNRVSMIEKSSGRLVAGMAAPVFTQLTEWILKNPSFQVLVSRASPTNHSSTSFYNKVNAESKQKKESDKKSEVETVRSNVRRMMKDILVERKKESSEIRISVEEIMKLVGKIEDDMYKSFKDTSHRYKAKYRTLMFNLKDPRNKVLYKRVLTGDIPPERLIWMTSDELATKELAQWREQETKHMIDMIKKEEENTNKTRLIKKTHKGEVDVDGDEDLSTLEATNIQEAEEKKPKVEEKVEVALVDTTEEHRAHLFDLNCKICTGKMAPPGEVVAKSPTMSNVTIQAAAESSIPSPPPIQEPSIYTEPLSPDSRGTPSDFSNLTEKAKESSIWKGFVMMPNVAKFGTNVFLVSGPGENLVQVLPDTLHVAGRIAHKHVWDYVKQCKTSSSRELCIIRFAAATDEEKISYVSLYSYFHSRKRCGVIGNCHSGIKDMYLVPLASHEPIPSPLLPFNGPGLQEPRPHMLLGIIVKNKNAPIKRSRSGSDRVVPSKTEPPSKRTSVDDLSSKSSTPTIQTPAKPSDSPVDEIEDIVFHYHNTQGGKPEPAKAAQPAGIPSMITALLKIQEQEKRLRELQKQSQLLEKELAPKMGNVASPVGTGGSSGLIGGQMQASVSLPNLTTGQKAPSNVSSHLSGQMGGASTVIGGEKATTVASNLVSGQTVNPPGPAKVSNNLGFPAVIPQASIGSGGTVLSVDGPKSAGGQAYSAVGATSNISQPDEDEPYDPETAENEETPYDPEDMDTLDISLDEVPSPEKGNTVLTPADSAQNTALSETVTQKLARPDVTGRLQQSTPSSTVGKPEMQVDSLVKQVNNQPGPEISIKPNQNMNQRSIPKELQEKVQALLKSEQGSLVQQTNNQPTSKPEGQFAEQKLHRDESGPERAGTAIYHHSRDFPEKHDFPERRDFSERRGYNNEGRDDPRFYSSRFSLNARSGSDEREGHEKGQDRGGHDGGGHHRGGHERGQERGYDRDHRSRDSREHRDGDRHWDDRRDDRRRDEYFNRNRDRFQRDRNWRR